MREVTSDASETSPPASSDESAPGPSDARGPASAPGPSDVRSSGRRRPRRGAPSMGAPAEQGVDDPVGTPLEGGSPTVAQAPSLEGGSPTAAEVVDDLVPTSPGASSPTSLRLRLKVWTDSRTSVRYLVPTALVGDAQFGTLTVYALSGEGTRVVRLTPTEWNALPSFYFKEDGRA